MNPREGEREEKKQTLRLEEYDEMNDVVLTSRRAKSPGVEDLYLSPLQSRALPILSLGTRSSSNIRDCEALHQSHDQNDNFFLFFTSSENDGRVKKLRKNI